MSVEQLDIPHHGAPPESVARPLVRRRRGSDFITNRIAVDTFVLVEILAIFALGLAWAEIYVRGVIGDEDYFQHYLAPLGLTPLFTMFILDRRGLHGFDRLCRFSNAIGSVGASLTLAFTSVIVAGFVAGVANEYSRVWFAGWYAGSLLVVLGLRVAAGRLFAARAVSGLIQKSIAIYGYGAPAHQIAEVLQRARQGVRLVGIFEPESEEGDLSETIAEFVTYARSRAVDSVIVALPAEDVSRAGPLLTQLSALPCEVQLYVDIGTGEVPVRGLTMLDGLAVLDIQRKPISDWGLIAKTIEDYVVASAAVVLLAPLFALIALAIRLDSPGPVFFVQRRHGFNNKVIRVWKFRTMHVMEDGGNFVQARRDDDRVTRVGRILRRTSLDELPQLINVLRGDMSVVGPRPHPLALNSRYAKVLNRYMDRHRVKPGITGWAQINGFRGPTDDPNLMRQRVELDLQYIESWSLMKDITIIAATPFVGLVNKNAV